MKSKFLGALSLILAAGVSFSGCAPKVRVMDKEVIESVKAVKKKDELYAEAYREGYEACNRDWYRRLTAEVEELKRIRKWNRYLRGGYVSPPIIAKIYVPGGVSEDGKVFTTPHVEYLIVRPARFEGRSIEERLASKVSYVFLGLFYTKEGVEERLREVKNFLVKNGFGKDDYELEVVPALSGRGRAVVVETKKAEVIKALERLNGYVIN